VTTAVSVVRLHLLSVVEESPDDFLVGDPRTGTFINVPAVGALVVRALLEDADPARAAAIAGEHAGTPVNVDSFIETLRSLGFTREADEDDEGRPAAPTIARNATIQQDRWAARVASRWAKPLFSPAAWLLYSASLIFNVCCFVIHPDLFSHAQDALVTGNRALGLLILMPLTYLTTGVHEAWHWLAGCALEVPVRFGADRRLCFLVFETDLSQLWSVPRRKRYGPQLAGMAVDSLRLALLLSVELLTRTHVLAPPSLVTKLITVLIFTTVATMLWQTMVFLRTDLYGVLVTATGCHNLWEVKTLLLRRAFGRLSPAQAAELAVAHPRDLAVGRWFRWLYVTGIPLVVAYVCVFYIPVVGTTARWVAAGLASDPSHGRFWTTLAASAALYLPTFTYVVLAIRARLRGRAPAKPRYEA
jgi:hypothetical protein